MKTKHTPGPWQVQQSSETHWLIRTPDDADGLHLGLAHVFYVNDDAATEANLNLIKAAPELLAACEAMLADIGSRGAHLATLRAAVAKARETS